MNFSNWKRFVLLAIVMVAVSVSWMSTVPKYQRSLTKRWNAALRFPAEWRVSKSYQQRKFIDTRVVAHALGGLPAGVALNCEECFQTTYGRGVRYFEVDLMFSQEGSLIALHDGLFEGFGIPETPTLAQFEKASLPGRVGTVDERRLVELLKEHRDWFLVTDVKPSRETLSKFTEKKEAQSFEFLRVVRHLCAVMKESDLRCEERVVPQLYFPEQVVILDEIPFERSVLTLYWYGMHTKEILAFVERFKAVSAVVMPTEWRDARFTQALRERGVQTILHTVNDAAVGRELLKEGVDAVYSDFLSEGDIL